MPSREQHMKADLKIGLDQSFPEVHQLLDQFAHYPDMEFLRRHRKFLHHKEGIEYVTMRWGVDAGRSAKQHVIDDCGHVPDASDYYDGTVDTFGFKIR
jgi:hypothetical protein